MNNVVSQSQKHRAKREETCLHCGSQQVTLAKILKRPKERDKILRMQTTKVCVNKACWSHIEINKIKTWKAI